MTDTQQTAVNLFHDDDLADFEEPSRRWKALARYHRVVPGSILGARALMFCQPLIVIIAPFAGIAVNAGQGGEDDAAATTTTTIAEQAPQGQGGGGGVVLLALLAMVVVVVGLPILATRLARLSGGARAATYAVEGLLLLLALGGLTNFFGRPVLMAMAAGFAASSAGILALISSQSARRAFTEAVTGDSSERFDIRSLPGLDT